jgi:hypothetical protein
MKSITIALVAGERSDGTLHITSEDLPGFHFILGPGEDPQEALLPALKEFVPLHFAYCAEKIRKAKPILKKPSSWNRSSAFGELSFAV